MARPSDYCRELRRESSIRTSRWSCRPASVELRNWVIVNACDVSVYASRRSSGNARAKYHSRFRCSKEVLRATNSWTVANVDGTSYVEPRSNPSRRCAAGHYDANRQFGGAPMTGSCPPKSSSSSSKSSGPGWSASAIGCRFARAVTGRAASTGPPPGPHGSGSAPAGRHPPEEVATADLSSLELVLDTGPCYGRRRSIPLACTGPRRILVLVGAHRQLPIDHRQGGDGADGADAPLVRCYGSGSPCPRAGTRAPCRRSGAPSRAGASA